MYTDKLDDVVNEYRNTYYTATKMKPIDVESNTYINFGLKNNDKDPELEVGYHVRISKYKNIFTKSYTNSFEKVFAIKNFKNTVSYILLVMLTMKKLLKLFTKKELRKTYQNNLALKK